MALGPQGHCGYNTRALYSIIRDIMGSLFMVTRGAICTVFNYQNKKWKRSGTVAACFLFLVCGYAGRVSVLYTCTVNS
jgi:hypothetical protein